MIHSRIRVIRHIWMIISSLEASVRYGRRVSVVTELARPTGAIDLDRVSSICFRWAGAVLRSWHARGAFMQFLGLAARLIDRTHLTCTPGFLGSAATNASPPFLFPRPIPTWPMAMGGNMIWQRADDRGFPTVGAVGCDYHTVAHPQTVDGPASPLAPVRSGLGSECN